jgi:hypothetical protein
MNLIKIIAILLIICILILILFSLLGTLGDHYICKNNKCSKNFFPTGDFSSKSDCEKSCGNEDKQQIKSETSKNQKIENFDFEKMSEALLTKYENNRESKIEYKSNRHYKAKIELGDNSWFTLCLPCERDEYNVEFIPFTNQIANENNSYSNFDVCSSSNNYIEQPYQNLTRYYDQNFWQNYISYPGNNCAFGNCRGRNCLGCNNHRRHGHHGDRHHRDRHNDNNVYQNPTINNNIKMPIIAYEDEKKSGKIPKVKHIIAPPTREISNKLKKSLSQMNNNKSLGNKSIVNKSLGINTEPKVIRQPSQMDPPDRPPMIITPPGIPSRTTQPMPMPTGIPGPGPMPGDVKEDFIPLFKNSYKQMNTTNNIPTDNFSDENKVITDNKYESPYGVFGFVKPKNKSKNNTYLMGLS